MPIVKEDNVLDPNQKARWGFSAGADGQIVVGPQTVEETGGVETIRTPADDKGAHNNGGGADEAETAALRSRISELEAQLQQAQKPSEPTDPRTKDQLKAELDEKGVTYPSNASKADLLALLGNQGSTTQE